MNAGQVDLLRRTIARGDGELRLSGREAGLLEFLADRAGETVDREELLERVFEFAPGLQSRALDTAMQRLRSKVELDAAEPDHLLTVRGRGYVFAPPLTQSTEAPPNAAPPIEARPAEAAPREVEHSLPPETTRFVGRDADVAEILDALSESRLVTLKGPGGVGKTRLARRVARAVLEAAGAPGGAWFCDLSTAGSGDDVDAEVIRGLRTRMEPSAEGVGAAIAARGPALLILDNCEHVTEACAERIPKWLSAAPEVRLLATSRETLPLSVGLVVEVDPLTEAAAIELLRMRAREQGTRQEQLGDEEGLLALVRELDQLPLALELAASRLALLGADALRRRLADRFRLLARRDGVGDPRHRTLRSAIDSSWGLLTPSEQNMLCRLSVFVGPFTVDDAEAVTDPFGESLGVWTVDALQALRDHSLVSDAGLAGDEILLRLLVSVRAYAAERLEESGDRAHIEERHQQRILAQARPLASRARETGDPDADEALARLVPDLLAIGRRSEERAPDTAAAAWLHASRGLTVHGFPPQRDEAMDRALACGQRADWDPQRLLAVRIEHAELGVRVAGANMLERVEGLLAECRTLDAPALASETLLLLGRVHTRAGRPQAARDVLLQSIAEAVAAGAGHVARCAYPILCGRSIWLGLFDEAGEELRRGRALAHAAGDVDSQARLAAREALLERARCRWPEALAACREYLVLAERLRDRPMVGYGHTLLAVTHESMGDLWPMEREGQAARDTCLACGSTGGAAVGALLVGSARLHRGDLDGAERGLEDALELSRRAGHPGSGVQASAWLALTWALKGDLGRGAAALAEVVETNRERGNRPALIDSLVQLATLDLVAGDEAAARRRIESAAEALAELDSPQQHAVVAPALAVIRALHGEHDAARRALEEASKLLPDPPERLARPLIEVQVAWCRAILAHAEGDTDALDWLDRRLEALEADPLANGPLARLTRQASKAWGEAKTG